MPEQQLTVSPEDFLKAGGPTAQSRFTRTPITFTNAATPDDAGRGVTNYNDAGNAATDIGVEVGPDALENSRTIRHESIHAMLAGGNMDWDKVRKDPGVLAAASPIKKVLKSSGYQLNPDSKKNTTDDIDRELPAYMGAYSTAPTEWMSAGVTPAHRAAYVEAFANALAKQDPATAAKYRRMAVDSSPGTPAGSVDLGPISYTTSGAQAQGAKASHEGPQMAAQQLTVSPEDFLKSAPPAAAAPATRGTQLAVSPEDFLNAAPTPPTPPAPPAEPVQPYAVQPARAAATAPPLTPTQPAPPPQPHAPGSTPIPAYGMPSDPMHPANVEATTTNFARVAAEALTQAQRNYAPGVPPPPIPYELQTDQQRLAAPNAPTYTNPRTGRTYVRQAPGQERGPLSVLDMPVTGAQTMGAGVAHMAQPGLRAKAGGLHQVIAGGLEAATPLMAAGAVAAPVATAATLAGATAAQSAVAWGLKKVGLPEEYADLAGDAAGFFAGIGVHKITAPAAAAIKAKYEPILKARAAAAAERANAPAPTANTTGTEPYRPPVAAAAPAAEAPSAVPVGGPVQSVAETPHVTTEAQTPTPPEAPPEEPKRLAAAPAPAQSTIEEPADGKQRTARVDAGTTGAVDAGRTGEGAALHGAAAPGAGSGAGRRPGRGEATDVVVPGEDRRIPAHYDVRELGDVQSSHNGQTFSANPNYEGQNERDYSKPENQQRVIEQSSEERFEPRYHVNDNPDMVNGPPLIDEKGNALGGNSRTMQLQRVYGRDGAKAAAYRALLEKKAAQFGIDPETIRGMQQPVLVRVATPEGLKALPGGSKWAVRKTNVAGTAALSASERAAADAGQMSPEMVTHIAGAIEDAGPDATLNDALTGTSGTRIVNRLITDGFFSEQERPALMDGKTGVLTQAAKDRIAKALVGKFFRNSDQIARTPASIKNKLERVAAPLAKVAGNPEWDITPEVRESIDLLEHASAHGIKNLSDVVNQTSMFGEAPKWPDGVVSLAQFLRDGKPNDVVNAFRKYVNSKEPTMFGESTPAEAFADAFGAEKPPRAPESEPAKPPEAPPAQRLAATVKAPEEGAPARAEKASAPKEAPAAREAAEPAQGGPAQPELPPEPSASDRGPVYMGSLLGSLEPLFREAKAAGDELKRTRNDALKAAQLAKGKPEERAAGVALRAWYTSERDLWAARAHQYIDIVTRKILPKIQEREAVGIAREFRHKPQELEQFINGTHPFLEQAQGGRATAMMHLDKLMPVMKSALRMLHDGMTPREKAADIVYTNLAEDSLKEGRAGGWLESRWLSDEYMPHLANPKGEGELPAEPSTAGRRQGKIGKYFGFAQRRADPYPTMVHAVADGLIPKTLDPSAAMNIHADQFARARASHMLEAELAREGLGHWSLPEMEGNWVPFAAHTDEFEKDYGYSDMHSGETKVAKQRLYVPEYIDKAFSPITDPDYLAKIPGFAKLRTFQRGLKQAILGLSGFHLLTETGMAKADIGPSAMLRALTTSRETPETLINEQDLIASGGTTSIQGAATSAYRGLKPGTIPTRGEVIRAYIPGAKETLELADKITTTTFDNVQRRYKIWGFVFHRDAWMADNPDASSWQIAQAKRGVASYTNGVYGGLHWENMGVSRAMLEIGRLALLAPDWTGSNLALAKYALSSPLSLAELRPRWAGGKPLRGAMTKTAVEARLARAFFVKQLVQGLTETQALSLMFSGQLSHRPFQVYLGKDKNGEDVYQNVVFRGSAGDFINLTNKIGEHGLLVGTGVFIGGKAAPVTKAGIHVLTGRDDLGRPITPQGMNMGIATLRSVGSLAADVSPVPLIMRSTAKTLTGDGSDNYLWSERALTLFGPPARHTPPAGTHMSGGVLRPNAEREQESILDQLRTGRVYKKRGAR